MSVEHQIKELINVINNPKISQIKSLLETAHSTNNHLLKHVSINYLKTKLQEPTFDFSTNTLVNNYDACKGLAFVSGFKLKDNMQHYQSINKMKENAIKHFDFLSKNINEKTVAISLYRCFEAFSFMSFSSHVFCSEITISSHCKLHNDFLDFDTKTELIDAMSNLKYGYYLARYTCDDESAYLDTARMKTMAIVCYQPQQIHFAEFQTIKEKEPSLHNLKRKTNPFFDLHSYSSNENMPQVLNKRPSIVHMFNEETNLAIFFLCCLISNEYKNIFSLPKFKQISYFNKIPSSNEIAIYNNKNVDIIKPFSVDDLKFKNDFSFLSFYDNLFNDELQKDIDYINYCEQLPRNTVTTISYRAMYKTTNMHQFSTGTKNTIEYADNIRHPRNHLLMSIPQKFHTSSNGRNLAYKFAKNNKISLIKLYTTFLRKDYFNEFKNQIETMLKSVNMFEKLKTHYQGEYLSYYGISNKNKNSLCHDVLASQKPEQKFDILSLRSFCQKTKAYKYVRIIIKNWYELKTLLDIESPLAFKNEAKYIANAYYAAQKINEIEKKLNIDYLSFADASIKDIPVELFAKTCFEDPITINIPLSKSQFNHLETIENLKLVKGW